MKVLKVIHGYPPIYNAGSEVYSQLLCNGLSNAGHEVAVFAREENPFVPDYFLRKTQDALDSSIKVYLINLPLERHRYRYAHDEVDRVFDNLVSEFGPDIIHIGHLNHLSLTLVNSAVRRNIPVVYTIHDFWLMCPRGQFIQRNSTCELRVLCDSQENEKCAVKCYSGYFSGVDTEYELDKAYWSDWVKRRMSLVRDICSKIDCFIAPSKKLMKRHVEEFSLPKQKLIYMDYGFDTSLLSTRKRSCEDSFVFGYIGTHIPAKGVDLLIRAFGKLSNEKVKLKIWGRSRAQNTGGLKRIVENLEAPVQSRIEWMPEYQNNQIVSEVFNHVDAIVVPSIWQENSPLVIHEALQARVGVITADFGGMSEYIKHHVNGWLFKHRDYEDLANVMEHVLSNRSDFETISQRGYFQNNEGSVPNIIGHAKQVQEVYESLIGGVK